MREIIGDLCHDKLVENTKQALGFDETRDYQEWKKEIKAKFYELLGFAQIEKKCLSFKY